MEKIRREIKLFWTRNGKLLLKIIGVIILIIFCVQSANEVAKMKNKQEEEYLLKNKENIERERLKKEKQQEYIEYISEFLDKCINKQIKEAYEMLSEECKEKKYSTIESFKINYIDKIFNHKREYKITQEGESFKVTFLEDILEAGKLENREKIEDYYCVEEDVLEVKRISINLYSNI